MANKKFYYRNKNKSQKPLGSQDVAADVSYSPEQLSRTIADLGISQSTCDLLAKGNLTTAAALVRCSDKDLYRLQGFNKKMLFEVKDALKAADMSLRSEQPRQSKPQGGAQNGKQPAVNEKKKEAKTEDSAKFGLADRRTDSKQQKPQKQAQQRPTKQEKLTEPLPIEQWRKVMKGGKWGFSDGFRIIVPTMYDEVFCFKEGLASVEIDGKCGYIDGENNIVIPFDYDTAMSFSEGFAMVVKGDKCGYINKNNEVVVPFEYDAATPFEGGEAKVKKDGKWATLTPDNNLVWI